MIISAGAVVVFARAPELGKVKTRLARTIGPERALALHRAFLADTLDAARATGAEVILAHTGDHFPEQTSADHLITQQGDGFGARFDHVLDAVRRHLGPGVPFVVVGSDSPHLGPERLSEALTALEHHDAVFGPNEGAGFHLVGFRDRVVPLSTVLMSDGEQARVLTLLRAGLGDVVVLPPTFDVDDAADLEHLLQRLRSWAPAGWRPRATMQALLG